MVTGFVTVAVQVAVTIVLGEDERWTDGSLTVQLEFHQSRRYRRAAGVVLKLKRIAEGLAVARGSSGMVRRGCCRVHI